MLGTGELLIIFLVVLLLFGGKKLPELARSLGLGIREFKRASQGMEENDPQTPSPAIQIETAQNQNENERR